MGIHPKQTADTFQATDEQIQKALMVITTAYAPLARIEEPTPLRPSTLEHLVEVGAMLFQDGYGSDVVVAGLLHELPALHSSWTFTKLGADFGPVVAELIDEVASPDQAVSETCAIDRLPCLSAEGLAIICADLVSELRNACSQLELGSPVALFVRGGWRRYAEQLRHLDRFFESSVALSLHGRFRTALEGFESLAASFVILYSADEE